MVSLSCYLKSSSSFSILTSTIELVLSKIIMVVYFIIFVCGVYVCVYKWEDIFQESVLCFCHGLWGLNSGVASFYFYLLSHLASPAGTSYWCILLLARMYFSLYTHILWIFMFFSREREREREFHCVVILVPTASASWVARIIGVCHHAQFSGISMLSFCIWWSIKVTVQSLCGHFSMPDWQGGGPIPVAGKELKWKVWVLALVHKWDVSLVWWCMPLISALISSSMIG